jgi:hypothetical protein
VLTDTRIRTYAPQVIVVVDGASGEVRMDDAENLRGLSVELRECGATQADALLGSLGLLDGEHVWLDIAALRALSPLAADPEWVAGYDGVISYAETKGWIDDTGSRVRAHIG